MAEEGNLGVARALESDGDSTKADLHSRLDEARESIKETATEIKDTVVHQYHSVKESVDDAVDWREQVRKRPIAWSLGALGVGILVGYGLAGLIEREDERFDDDGSEDRDAAPIEYEAGGPSAFTDHHSYAAHARALPRVDDEQSALEEARPGIINRFKETRAYDRLQDEVSDLGNRLMDGLADAARSIVLPAFFRKIKEIIGIDMSNKRSSENTPTPRPAAEAVPVTPSSEGGKAAYPKSAGSVNKFDRLARDKPGAQSESTPHINLNYDDRYERESKLFSRGEDRGFGARTPSESKPATDEKRSTDSDDVPHGIDFSYEPGHADNN